MIRDDEPMRAVLWVSAAYNAGGASVFAFPETFATVSGFPADVHPMHRGLLALFVLLFGGAYAWLARQTEIDRPLVAFSAVGKAGAFAVVLRVWIAGGVPARSVALITGDLVLAVIFALWLVGSGRDRRATLPSARSRGSGGPRP